jgi:ATP-binding cassette subfamily F protein uup
MLLDFGVTALIVTHDRYFLDRVATSILAFEGDGQVVHYPGGYETFRRLRAEAREARKANEKASEAPSKSAPAKTASKKKALTQSEQRELEQLPDAIDRAERAVAALNDKLADPATYAAGSDVTALKRELESARAKVDELTLRWEELETKSLAT